MSGKATVVDPADIAADSMFKDSLRTQVASMQETLDAMHIRIRQLLSKPTSSKDELQYLVVGLHNLTQTTINLMSAVYQEQQLHVALKQLKPTSVALPTSPYLNVTATRIDPTARKRTG